MKSNGDNICINKNRIDYIFDIPSQKKTKELYQLSIYFNGLTFKIFLYVLLWKPLH